MEIFKKHPARTSFVSGMVGGFVAVNVMIACAILAHGPIEK